MGMTRTGERPPLVRKGVTDCLLCWEDVWKLKGFLLEEEKKT